MGAATPSSGPPSRASSSRRREGRARRSPAGSENAFSSSAQNLRIGFQLVQVVEPHHLLDNLRYRTRNEPSYLHLFGTAQEILCRTEQLEYRPVTDPPGSSCPVPDDRPFGRSDRVYSTTRCSVTASPVISSQRPGTRTNRTSHPSTSRDVSSPRRPTM